MDPNTSPSCAVITDMLELKIRPGPAGLLFNPVFPANEPNKFVGFATTSIHWEEVLTNIVPDYVNGLTCVVSTATASFTFVIQTGGVVELMGPGDMHHNQYDSFAESVVLNDIVTGASTSAVYTLTVYPSDAMFEIFRTISPLAVALAFLGVIFLCTILFFFYDYLMRHEAEQRKLILDMKRRFVRFISHEIRTPLNTVCVGLELLEGELRKDTSKGRKQKDTAAFNPSMEDIDFWYSVTVDVKENAGIAVSILNDMLNYDKLETKTLDLEAEEINIWEIIEQTTHQFQLHAINRGIDLKLNWEPTKSSHSTSLVTSENVSCISDDPEVSPLSLSNIDYINLCVIGDDVRLSQVFRNIISNALKFTPQHGKIRISATHNLNGLPAATDIIVHGKTISNERRRGSLIVKISDSGVGLTKEQLHLLFAEGLQFDANKLQHGGGSGLGLSIAKGIVELHRGTIDAMSAGQGHGTTFLVELPLYELSAAKNGGKAYQVWQTHTQTEVESTVSGDDATSIPFIAKKILVVDDAQSSRKMLIRLLERDGHTCIQASNGQDAVQAIELDIAEQEASTRSQLGIHTHKSIDTILMDFEMPFMNGPDATRAIRGIGFNGTIIGVTGNVLSEDVDYFKESGADVVLAKPISMDRLREYWNPQCISERDRNRNITF